MLCAFYILAKDDILLQRVISIILLVLQSLQLKFTGAHTVIDNTLLFYFSFVDIWTRESRPIMERDKQLQVPQILQTV